MRRLLLLGSLCAMSVLALTPVAGATSYIASSCEEIETQEVAQGTLDDPAYGTGEVPGGPTDPLNLDPDGDGVACNDPGNTVGGEAPEEPICMIPEGCDDQYGGQYEGSVNLGCRDFTSQAEAQEVLDADPTDPNGLDDGGDGLACQHNGGAAPDPTGREVPKPNATAVGFQYDPESNIQYDPESNSVVDVVEEAAEDAAESAPDAVGSLTAAQEAAFRAARVAGADEQVAEALVLRAAEGAVVEKEDAPSSEGGAGKEEDNAFGGIAELPATGGVSLALGGGALLVAGGLVARRIIG